MNSFTLSVNTSFTNNPLPKHQYLHEEVFVENNIPCSFGD